jgi:hypothetical protein
MKLKTALALALVLAIGSPDPTKATPTDPVPPAPIPPTAETREAYERAKNQTFLSSIVEFSCLPSSYVVCNNGRCTPAAPTTFYFVDHGTEAGTYFRCDKKGCDEYQAIVSVSGEYTTIVLPANALLFRVDTGTALPKFRGDFVDIATTGTTAVISTGKCEFGPRSR